MDRPVTQPLATGYTLVDLQQVRRKLRALQESYEDNPDVQDVLEEIASYLLLDLRTIVAIRE